MRVYGFPGISLHSPTLTTSKLHPSLNNTSYSSPKTEYFYPRINRHANGKPRFNSTSIYINTGFLFKYSFFASMGKANFRAAYLNRDVLAKPFKFTSYYLYLASSYSFIYYSVNISPLYNY